MMSAVVMVAGCLSHRPTDVASADRTAHRTHDTLAALGDLTASVHVADRGTLPAAGEASATELRVSNGAMVRRLTCAAGVIEETISPLPGLGRNAWRRSLAFTNQTDETVDLLRAELGLRLAGTDVVWAQHPFLMVRLPDGRLLCAAGWNRNESTRLRHLPDGGIALTLSTAWRLTPGTAARTGDFELWIADANGPDATRREARRWYALHGFTTPIAYPSWVDTAIFYEASAAGHIDSRFSDTGGFDAFARQIPYLAALGINAVWLNAVQTHKDGKTPMEGWNHYAPRDQLEIDPILGGRDRFAALTRTMRAHGMHLISEVVPHGGRSLQAAALSQWHTKKRDGTPRGNWGGHAMDNASPEWQATLRRSMRMLADAGEIEGGRIDVALGQGPNWGSPRTPHASYSTVAACLELMRALADGIRTERCPSPILIPECQALPELFTVPNAATLGYGWEYWMATRGWGDDIYRTPHKLAARLREAFERERGSLPPGALTLRTLNNHDTVCHRGRAAFRFGTGLQRALYAVMLSVPGVPMMYQEEEIGSFFALQRLNRARRSLPQLARSPVTYPAPGTWHPDAFVAVRPDPDAPVLCLVNLSGHHIDARGRRPACFPGTTTGLRDAVAGRCVGVARDGSLHVRLAPYAAAFLVDAALPRGPARTRAPADTAMLPAVPTEPAEDSQALGVCLVRQGDVSVRLAETPVAQEKTGAGDDRTTFACTAGTLTVGTRGDGTVRIRGTMTATPDAPGITLVVTGTRRWQVSGQSALLDDLVLRRHFPFPEGSGYTWRREHCWGHMAWRGLYRGVAPSGRLWQSLIEPLHPSSPGIAFRGLDGSGLVVTDITTDAMNIVLTNCDDETPEPPRLELRFLGIDTDLAHGVQHVGRGQPWRVTGMGPVTQTPLTIDLVLRPVATPGAVRALPDAPRRPVQSNGAVMHVDAPKTGENGGRLFLPQAGTVTWTGLCAVPGAHIVELELRRSERSAGDTELTTAYAVELNGKPMALTWGTETTWSTGNAYFTTARIGPVDLSHGPHTLSIRTDHTWCALNPVFTLRPAP